LNFFSRRHPKNVVRRDAILAELLKDFPPHNFAERSEREQLADVLEQLETTRPGTTEYARLAPIAKQLRDDLSPPVVPTQPGLSHLPDFALEEARALFSRLANGDELSDFEQGQLDILQRAMNAELSLTANQPSEPPDNVTPAPRLVVAEPTDAGAEAERTNATQTNATMTPVDGDFWNKVRTGFYPYKP
jgi:hypothetical protein